MSQPSASRPRSLYFLSRRISASTGSPWRRSASERSSASSRRSATSRYLRIVHLVPGRLERVEGVHGGRAVRVVEERQRGHGAHPRSGNGHELRTGAACRLRCPAGAGAMLRPRTIQAGVKGRPTVRTVALALLGAALVVVPSSAHAQEKIDGQYIVVLKDAASTTSVDRAKEKARDRGGRIQRESFGRVLKGFSAKLDSKALDGGQAGPGGGLRRAGPRRPAQTRRRPTRRGAWIGSTSATCRSARTYSYGNTGAGVKAYIIDTGIRTHAQRVRRPRDERLRRDRRRRGGRLQRPRHARRGHGRRQHVRRREGRVARRRARARLQRLGLDVGRDRGRELGHDQPRGRAARRWPT